ncbi:MAG: hypothetical protein HVN34_08140 [Methanobacteriaceae archaeon]|nr:hypothetical protein [Methanobacteriaceae archaeon]OPY24295.1 MAG: hypothetical protein A4E26_00375 [Methanobacterium sp. PtaU1.Bin097]
MNSAVKYFLLFILCVVFFEAGLISANTIVSGEPPDIGKLIDMQLDGINSLIHLLQGSQNSTQKAIDINNENDVAQAIQNKSEMNGVNLQSLSAHTNESTRNENITVTITLMAYKTTTTSGNSTNGSIIIKPDETYSITATAIGKVESGGITVDLNSIVITTVRKLYSNSANGT